MRSKFSCLLLLCVLFTVAPAASPDILASESDHRVYEALVLSNGLRVVLISDPTTDKAAASLDLNVGSGSDPDDREGLAHLLEHMLFLGTDRYPKAGEYQEFIRSRGGNHNAYTSVDHTNYYFDIEASHLAGALDRFARFFVAPTLDSQLIASERSVVQAEYSSKQEADGRRIWVARRQALDPAHPQAGFSVGSEETLADRPGDRVTDDLQAFYLQHYHAGRMVLAVLGKEPLKDLEGMVRSRFDDVPAGTSRAVPDSVTLYATDTLPIWQVVEPKKELRQLSFIFPVPSIRKLYATKPLSYVANLLGHEGPGSLLAVLKAKGWAESLSAGSGMVRDAEGTFEVSIGLTPVGLEHIESIGEMLFDAIRRVRDHGIDEWRYAEQKQLAKMQFRFQEAVEPITLTRSLAARWHEYPLEDLLYAGYRYDELVKAQVTDYLSRMTPENLHLLLVAPGQETDQVDPWYGVRYRLTPLLKSWVEAWRAPPHVTALALPVMNPFVSNDFSLRESPDTTPHPVRIVIEPG
ncbi:MAG: insulinase family protein, partial [Arenicellales bacterium]|nr:insulinase family protein [Arenicellales bacterium]